jgi:hypothetical protein
MSMVTLRSALFAATSVTVLLTAGAASAQANNASATTSATVISSQITVSKTRDMNLGTIARPNSGVFTVTIAAGGGRSGSGGSGGFVLGGAGTTALFNVGGEANRTFTITTPTTITLATGAGGSNREVVFSPQHLATSTLDPDPSGFNVRLIEVHGDLDVPAATESGAYQGNLPVTVQYQ